MTKDKVIEQMREALEEYVKHDSVPVCLNIRKHTAIEALAALRELQSKFEPDWSLLEATQQSLREHQDMLRELQANHIEQPNEMVPAQQVQNSVPEWYFTRLTEVRTRLASLSSAMRSDDSLGVVLGNLSQQVASCERVALRCISLSRALVQQARDALVVAADMLDEQSSAADARNALTAWLEANP